MAKISKNNESVTTDKFYYCLINVRCGQPKITDADILDKLSVLRFI